MSTDAVQTLHRPPREYPPAVPSERVRIAPPPTEAVPPHHGVVQMLFPLVGGVSLVGFALIVGSTAFLYVAIGMMFLLVLFSVLMRWSQKRATRRRAAEQARRYARYLHEQDQLLAESGELQRGALARLYPDAGALWSAMIKRRGVWERRPGDQDFLHVRLGRGTVALDGEVDLDLGMNPLTEYQPVPLHEARRLVERRGTLRNQPVVVDAGGVGVLAVTGDRDRSRAWTRGLLLQLAAFRSPHDLRIAVAHEPAAAQEWGWVKWLPHARAGTSAALARDAAELEALLEPALGPRLEQLQRLAEADGLAARTAAVVEPELVVVLDGYEPGHPANASAPFRELLERARDLRALVVLLCDERAREPSAIDARLALPPRGPARFDAAGRDAETVGELVPDAVDADLSEAIARVLAPLRLAEGGGERGLGGTVRLVDLLGSRDASASRRSSLRMAIGMGADGEVVELDLKQAAEEGMGPHGVLVGATGSGKSELLRSIVAGLAASHDPEALAFVLVDYKGGAAFAELSRLPHVAGLITNLRDDDALVDRMHAALTGEQERRQTMLRDAGNLDDVVAYRRRRDADPGMPPLPDLLVIVDEFAELLQARPEFIDLFVGLGRVGRSLGIHLLLASQRLDEGRLRGLDSHLRYRICLRTYSAADSKVVLGTPDAFLLPALPGLGYLKVDTSVYRQFRAALSSTPHRTPDAAPAAPAEVRAFDAAVRPAGPAAPAAPSADAGPSDLEVLVDRVAGGPDAAGAVHQVWVPPLPAALPLDAVETAPPFWAADRDGAERGLRAALGRVDRPLEQRAEPLVLDLTGSAGHVALVGAPQTGKSTAVRTLLAALARAHSPAEWRAYAVDLGGGLLGALEAAPQVGGVVRKLDREAVHRVVAQLRAELEERDERFRRLRLESMAEARALRAEGIAEDLADVLLVVDGWDSFKREFEGLDRELEELAAAGLAFGIHVVVTANRWADIRPALLDNLGTRLELRLNDPLDSLQPRQVAAALPAGVPGRGLTGEGLHFHCALPRVDGAETDDGLAPALGALLDEVARRWTGPRAEPIRLLPSELDAADLPPSGREGVAIGIEERRLSPVRVDLAGGDPHFLVFGDAETGKSSLLRRLAGGLAATHPPDELRLVVGDVRRSLADLAELPHVTAYATSAQALEQAAAALAGELAARPPGARPDVRHVLLVDDYDLLAGAAGSPLAALVDLLALGRDLGLHVVLTRRVGGSARGQYEAVFSRVRELGSPGVLLSGDPGEGPLLGGVKAAPQRPGRGLYVERGRRPVTVQLGLARPGEHERPAVGAASWSEGER